MAGDGFETKRSVWAEVPPSSASLPEREAWAARCLPRFFDLTGGEWPEPPEAVNAGAFVGRRWRQEFADAVRDPQAFAEYAQQQIQAYQSRAK
jgi:hypothetical protein